MDKRRHWLGLPVTQPVEGTLNEVLKSVPHFGRQPFSMASVNGDEIGVNPFLDMVYRVASKQGQDSIPVGVVSKNYRLVDHHHALRTVQDVLAENQIDLSEVWVRGEWTIHGERARFSLILPAEDRFKMQLGSGDDMRFRIEIFNSVEGSCRLMAVAGWLRFVCANGLILGTALMQLRQQHTQQLQIEELGRLLREAIQSVGKDKKTLEQWLSDSIDNTVVLQWVDEDVRKLWGAKAAVRVFGLVVNGCDVEPVGELKNRKPSEIATRTLGPVPGVDGPAKQLFGVSQVLSWLAGQRAELAGDSAEGDHRFRREGGQYSGMIPVSRRSDATLVL